MTTHIIGAGMAGLLAGNMLRNQEIKIFEGAAALPNNHAALLRFRTRAVSDVTGITFKKVNVIKDVHTEHKTRLAAMASYSMKVNGKPSLRSINSAFGAEVSERYIAPPDFIKRMSNSLESSIVFGYSIDLNFINSVRKRGDPIISTMPMDALANLLGYKGFTKSKFEKRDGAVLKVGLPVDWEFYATLYLPDDNCLAYRSSITGNEMIIEFPKELESDCDERKLYELAQSYLDNFGLGSQDLRWVKYKKQPYAKIQNIDEAERKDFILWASKEWNIYSLGRFATWRPGLLLDDVVHDVRLIQAMIEGDNSKHYEEKKNG